MRINLARTSIGVVILFNLQAAIAFLLYPERYISSFELQGAVGIAVLRGLGVLFVMWNVPYGVALWHPIRHRISLYEALVMQFIGLIGETAIYLSLPANYDPLRASIIRFILFDAFGILLLIISLMITRRSKNKALEATILTME